MLRTKYKSNDEKSSEAWIIISRGGGSRPREKLNIEGLLCVRRQSENKYILFDVCHLVSGTSSLVITHRLSYIN